MKYIVTVLTPCKNTGKKYMLLYANTIASDLNSLPLMFQSSSTSVSGLVGTLVKQYENRAKKGKGVCTISTININYSDDQRSATINQVGEPPYLKIECVD